ncbi:MAG TPA: hypothetical protein VKD72_24620 [Gemmataceae bacterium]|nr:hypothetical protein [Gemmataceae bacterium]
MTKDRPLGGSWDRRKFLATVGGATSYVRANRKLTAAEAQASTPLKNATFLGDKFVSWQAPYGGPDPKKCPYRTPGKFDAYHLHGCGPMARALYRLYRATNNDKYKAAADGYALFLINALHDPPTPFTNTLVIDGAKRTSLSSSWMYGKALAPCYEEFCKHNPNEDFLERKAITLFRWLQRHRRDDSYFGVGYPAPNKAPDCQNSCDLGEVGYGLMGYYEISRRPEVLKDAVGLAKFFLTDYVEGAGKGIWSPRLGVWLVSLWPASGEHMTDQAINRVGWGWSAYIDSEYLLRLRAVIDDKAMRTAIADKSVKALRWCLDVCQFDDGAHGMVVRDDKWVGMTAAAVLLYEALIRYQAISAKDKAALHPRIEKSWQWLVKHTTPETFPADGYIAVTRKTTKRPLENLTWMMAWTCEALLLGPTVFKT